MKKLLCMLLALGMVISVAAAQEAPDAGFAPVALKLNEEIILDLNGDGTDERMVLTMVGPENEQLLTLHVIGADGKRVSHESYIIRSTDCFVLDLNGDGSMEILLSGDEWSWDFTTTCLNYTAEGQLAPLLFADAGRFPGDEPYAPFGYGMVSNISEDGTITLTGTQDVLGTWMAGRDFVLTDGRFELAEGMFLFDIAPSDWTDRPLILKQDITLGEGEGALSLKAGDKIMPVGSDRKSFVKMITESGREFDFRIEFQDGERWGWVVNGIFEEDLFEYVPYAD